MGAMKNYMMGLVCMGDTADEQEAIEWAITWRWFDLTYKREVDELVIEQNRLTFLRRYREERAKATVEELV